MGPSPFDSKCGIQYYNFTFLYGIIQQGSDYFLLNFLTSKFNEITDQQLRKLKVHDWILSIKWLINIYEFYDYTDFHYSFCKRMFHDELIDMYFDNLYRAQHYLENIESLNNFEDLKYIDDKRFCNNSFYDLYKKNQVKEDVDFFSLSIEEQETAMRLYTIYLNNLNGNNFGDQDESYIVSDSIDTMLRKVIFQDLNTQENVELLRGVCHKFMLLKKDNPDHHISDDIIEQNLIEVITLNSNLILIAYYLHYIIASFGAIPKKKTKSGISVFSGKQADLLQRLLCSVTTHHWETADLKSNTYYKTVNNLFKFEKLSEKDNYERDKVLEHLSKVKKMLTTGGFDYAVELLDKDVITIKDEN